MVMPIEHDMGKAKLVQRLCENPPQNGAGSRHPFIALNWKRFCFAAAN
jgi:hypothetical protein